MFRSPLLLLGILGLINACSGLTTLTLNHTYPLSLELSVQICVGHLNRLNPNTYYTLGSQGGQFPTYAANDQFWLDTLHPSSTPQNKDLLQFLLQDCLPILGEVIEYNYEVQREFAPQIVTASISLYAVAISTSVETPAELLQAIRTYNLALNVTSEWSELTALETVKRVFNDYASKFPTKTSVVKIDPGYKYAGDHRLESQIFEFFSDGDTTTAVYGYDDFVPLFGGDTYEAETNCIKEHNIGQVASTGVNNIQFYSSFGAIEKPLDSNPIPTITYNASKTYVAFVVGDGDNFWHLKNNHMKLFLQRLQFCTADPSTCYPMSWSIAPSASQYMPDIINYYSDIALNTTKDYFVLPPSGSLYSYPGLMSSDVQKKYIERMEGDMNIYNTRISVHWEWFYNWRHTISTYFNSWSEYTTERTGFILANVPYLLPMFIFRLKEYRIIGENVVLFKPNEWRYSSAKQSHTTEEMGDIINGFKPGYISPVYMTVDGSLEPIQATYDLYTEHLEEWVEVVPVECLVELVFEKESLERGGGEKE
ncbi:hypothetical protein TL16_g10565 [Triparma laevis f. inornata]|uniref:GxGYxYP putative glycoside hydrolase C-terminal domain-containing protein n=1 Tax=Triparma laevis f. inornata TaxID=1714386 RepID=A0A9W7EQQ2_9STRA|nr:hypothetical protein TL16_g10565 [Triparma laevis f. inornata]